MSYWALTFKTGRVDLPILQKKRCALNGKQKNTIPYYDNCGTSKALNKSMVSDIAEKLYQNRAMFWSKPKFFCCDIYCIHVDHT